MGITFNRLTPEEIMSIPDEEAVLHFYDADGKRVKEGSAASVRQYLSNDPNRPDAKKSEKATSAAAETVKAVSEPAEDKAIKSPAETK
jgi:hypothetical protein